MYATQALQVAADNLFTWHQTFVQARYLPSFAQMSLIRAALEGGSRTRWLVDAAVTSRQRAERGARAQLESIVEMPVRGDRSGQARRGGGNKA